MATSFAIPLDASSESRCPRDQKPPRCDGNDPGGVRDALTARRETFEGDGRRNDSHRSKIHHADRQEDPIRPAQQ